MGMHQGTRRWVAGTVGLTVGAVVALGATTLVTPSYEAYTDVLLTPAAEARAADVLHERLLGSYAQMLDTRTVAQAVHSRLPSTTTVGSISTKLDGSVVEGTSMLRATVRDTDPAAAAALSDAAAASLVDLMAQRGIAAAPADTGSKDSMWASIVEDATVPQLRPSPTLLTWRVAVGALVGLLLFLAPVEISRPRVRPTRRAAHGHGLRQRRTETSPGRHAA